MDIADPDELVTFAVDKKGGGAHSFFTDYNNPEVVELSHQAQQRRGPGQAPAALLADPEDGGRRRRSWRSLYYSPFRYAYRSNVKGFVVYPLGNYHLEDVWLALMSLPALRRPAPAGADPDPDRDLDPRVHALHLIPGDPALTILGNKATPARVAALHHEWGLDRPLPVQYEKFVGRVVHGRPGPLAVLRRRRGRAW